MGSQVSDLSKESTKSLLSEISKESTESLSPDLSKELMKSLLTELSKELTESLSPVLSKELTKSLSPDLSKELTKSLSPVLSKELTKSLFPELSKESTKSLLSDLSKESTKSLCSSILSLVKSHPRISTITIFGTGTGTIVYLLYRIRKSRGQCELRTQIEQLLKSIGQLQKNIGQLQKNIEQLQKNIEKAKPSEPEHGELRTQIAETTDPAMGDLQETLNQHQIELHQLRTKLHQLQNELEWRKARNETDDITLDASTAHPNLSIAGDKKSLKHEAQPQRVPANQERFDSTVCVLGSEGFSIGKHYWEVDVTNSSDWDLGVARKSIQRKGKLPLSPKEGFWALGLSGRDYWAKTDPWTQVTVQKKPQKIGVYLSYQDGQVTFFSVTDMSVLFTFNDCSFLGEVYPFFKNSHKETTMRVCSIKEKSV